MFNSKKFLLSVVAALAFQSQSVQAVAITSRADVTREVYIPQGQTLTQFCDCWQEECKDLAHHAGKPYDVCSAGYAGPGTARVDCLAVTSNTTAVDYTVRVANALDIKFVA